MALPCTDRYVAQKYVRSESIVEDAALAWLEALRDLQATACSNHAFLGNQSETVPGASGFFSMSDGDGR